MPLASVALNEARLLLNDVGAKLYNDTILLPVLRKAYRELQQQLIDNGVSVAREATAALTVLTGVTTISSSSTPALPTDILYPIMLHERYSGQSDTDYVEMTETVWAPDITPISRLQYWNWSEGEIKTPGATGTVILRIRYWKSLAAITDGTTNIPILDSETFLAARTAAIAAFSIGGMPAKSQAFNEDAAFALSTFLSTSVKNRQALPVRRQPFKRFRRPFGLFWR